MHTINRSTRLALVLALVASGSRRCRTGVMLSGARKPAAVSPAAPDGQDQAPPGGSRPIAAGRSPMRAFIV